MKHASRLMAALLIIAACADAPIAPVFTIYTIRINKTSIDLAIGESATVICTEYQKYGDNGAESVYPDASFTVSTDKPAVATVSGAEQAKGDFSVKGITPGTARITCKSKTSADITVTVHEWRVFTTPLTLSMSVGEQKKIVAKVLDFRGGERADIPVTWSFAGTGVFTASAAGTDATLNAIGAGSGTATATAASSTPTVVPVTVTAPAAPTCITAPSTVVFSVQKMSDPGGYDGTIGLGAVSSITTQMSATATAGNVQFVGGNKMNGYNVDQVNANGPAPNAANNCSMNLNGGAIIFGPGAHRTRLYGNATRTVGTKLTYDFLDFITGALETRYEFTVVSVQ